MQGQIDANHREALGHFDEIYRRLERLDQEHVAVTQALRRLEPSLCRSGRRQDLRLEPNWRRE
jgi:DNA-binding SARP family transcriptional activator